MHVKTNHISACVSDNISSPARVSDDISGPIRLWHMSPIRLRHMLLTHPQNPINRSLPKAFQRRGPRDLRGIKPSRAQGSSIKEDSEVLKLYWNQTLKLPAISRTSTLNARNIQSRII